MALGLARRQNPTHTPGLGDHDDYQPKSKKRQAYVGLKSGEERGGSSDSDLFQALKTCTEERYLGSSVASCRDAGYLLINQYETWYAARGCVKGLSSRRSGR